LVEDSEHVLVRLLETKLFSNLVEMQVDLAFLLPNPLKASIEVKPVALADLEQKLDSSIVLLAQSGLFLLLETLSQLKQLVVSDQNVDAQIQLRKVVFIVTCFFRLASLELSPLLEKPCNHFIGL
jgi:hypothetical protein